MNAFRFQKQAAAPDQDLLPPDRARRRIERQHFQTANDVVDAHFVVVRDPPQRAKFQAASATSAPAAPDFATGLTSLLRRVEHHLQRLSDMSFALLVAGCFASIFGIAGQLYSGSGSIDAMVNPLDITHVSLTPQYKNGMQVLLLNAIVENRSDDTVSLPKLRADLLIGGQIIASTYIDAPVSDLDGGHSRGVAARLQHPGGKTPELRLSFEDPGVSPS
ncbi:hypothetical protein [Rhizobium sp. 18065]|uniref:hypothetical protein n=1 Tax=Rhizobium sp. 18065 TaxID=2681411 RepID=UPI00135C2D8C|nr:hypothetical protein [Rhizobium sp. 18065]